MVKAKNKGKLDKKKDKSKDRPKVVAGKRSRPPTMLISREREIAMDFAMKIYKEFDQMIKSVILFGSTAKKKSKPGSDIDILVIIDDVGIRWDMELVAWYREELADLIKANPYVRPLHINTMKLSTWWEDMMRGDPVVLNVIRYGDALVDFGGFFNPLKILMARGKIKSTPEAVYTLLQRSPRHMARASQSLLAAVDGIYWTMIDSAHAALISANVEPSSPENVAEVMRNTFVKDGSLDKKYVKYYEEVHGIAKEIIHGKRVSVEGKELEKWFSMADDFLREMARLVDDILEKRGKS